MNQRRRRRGCCGCGGWGVGNILALVMSYNLHHSIFKALIHGFLGWLYVIYSVLFH